MPIVARSTIHGSPCDRCHVPGDTCWLWLDGEGLTAGMKTVCGRCALAMSTDTERESLRQMDKLMRREMVRGSVVTTVE